MRPWQARASPPANGGLPPEAAAIKRAGRTLAEFPRPDRWPRPTCASPLGPSRGPEAGDEPRPSNT